MVLMSVRVIIALNMKITSMFFFGHRWYHGSHNRAEISLVGAGVKLFHGNIENVDLDACLNTLSASRKKRLSRTLQLILGLNCTDCLEGQVYLAYRGEIIVRSMLTTLFAPLGRSYSLIRLIGGRASHLRCRKGFRLCNPCTNAPGYSFDNGPPSPTGSSCRTI